MNRILQASALVLTSFLFFGCNKPQVDAQAEMLKIQKYESALREIESWEDTRAKIKKAKSLALQLDDKESLEDLIQQGKKVDAEIEKLRAFTRENRPDHLIQDK